MTRQALLDLADRCENDQERCLTCWEHGPPYDGPCQHCGYGPAIYRRGKPYLVLTRGASMEEADD